MKNKIFSEHKKIAALKLNHKALNYGNPHEAKRRFAYVVEKFLALYFVASQRAIGFRSALISITRFLQNNP
ncbi:hypothetical protein [Leptospira yasudae]|uniref:Uncharacterized protein n=1 Tax=Leptospira yasudae TaxID=2202201 RepID=A0ABX9M754_9LEPT|nr:hypothetical protein [Leptospira yasudae]RHX81919.1 hypothetical protein DLM77_00125 [Leptospira yasudae]